MTTSLTTNDMSEPTKLLGGVTGKGWIARSGNPGGTIAGTPKLKTALLKLLSLPAGARFVPKTKSDQLALKTLNMAMRGNERMVSLIWDRVEGKVKDVIEVHDDSARIELAVQML